jgi:hypothetical protein
MPTRITLQPAPNERDPLKLPYPFHVNQDGEIQRQDVWRGHPLRVCGFAADPHRREIDLRWEDAVTDPQRAVGMHLVTADSEGGMATHLSAIASVRTSTADADA